MKTTISLRELRAKIKADPATKDMIRPSLKNSIYLDVDGDGPADFAFISSDFKGDTVDTFAVALTNSGDFDVYLYNCFSEDVEMAVCALDSDNLKMLIPAGEAIKLMDPNVNLIDILSNFNGETFAKIFKGIKASLVKDYESGKFAELGKTVSLRELRAKMKAAPETKDMLRPCAKNAIFLDVDGDGPADFAIICSNPKVDSADTLAVDLSNDGEFDIYIFNAFDVDKAELVAYDFDGDVPKFTTPVKQLGLADYLSKVIAIYRNFDAKTYAAAAKNLKDTIAKHYSDGEYKMLGD